MGHIMKFNIKTSVIAASLALVTTTILFSTTVVHAQGMQGQGYNQGQQGFDQGQGYNQGQQGFNQGQGNNQGQQGFDQGQGYNQGQQQGQPQY
jgi:hypothetical protein